MNSNIDMKNPSNSQEQIEALKEICIKHSVSFADLSRMLETEKVKKLHKRNHYISHVISEIIEG